MIRLLYVSDYPIFESNGGDLFVYPQIGENHWKKFREIFPWITLAGRIAGRPSATNLIRINECVDDVVLLPNLRKLPVGPFLYPKCRSILSENITSHDVFICRIPGENGILASNQIQKSGKPYAIEVAGCGYDAMFNYGGLLGKIYAPIYFRRMKGAVKAAPNLLYVTNQFLQSRYPNHLGYKVACSNVDIPSPSKDVLDRRIKRIRERNSTLRLGLIGTLRGRFKGIQTVLQALSDIRDKVPPMEFHVLGAGEKSSWQHEANTLGISDMTIFDGTREPGPQVWEWLDNIDIYLQPSLKEGLPRALIEAMSRGCPAIGTKCAGIPELLDEACLIQPGNSRQLGEILVETMQDRAWMLQQARRNWEISKEYAADILDERRKFFWSHLARIT